MFPIQFQKPIEKQTNKQKKTELGLEETKLSAL